MRRRRYIKRYKSITDTDRWKNGEMQVELNKRAIAGSLDLANRLKKVASTINYENDFKQMDEDDKLWKANAGTEEEKELAGIQFDARDTQAVTLMAIVGRVTDLIDIIEKCQKKVAELGY